jgi:hypothetical protein
MEFTLPLALFALALPIVVLALAFVPQRPVRTETGALELWRRVAELSPRGGARSNWRPPAWIVVVALGLVAWALALAAPLVVGARDETWHVLVDRRAHMLLDVEPGTTRLASVLELVREQIERERGDVNVSWSSPGLDDLVTRSDEPAPLEHFLRAPVADVAPHFAAHDRAGVVFASANFDELVAVTAGRAASGGGEVLGPVAAGPDGFVVWNGAGFVVEPSPRSAGRVVIEAGVPELVVRFAAVFAQQRGLEITGADSASEREGDASAAPLRLVLAAAAPSIATDGAALDLTGSTLFAGAFPVARLVSGGPLAPTKHGVVAVHTSTRDRSVPLAVAAMGRITFAPGEWLEADPSDFALGLSATFDSALSPDARLVPVAGRRAQGEPRVELGAPPPPTRAPVQWRAPLGALAALLFALAAWLRRR